jgi:glycosyltransferase involved in cell wall biosynthesis
LKGFCKGGKPLGILEHKKLLSVCAVIPTYNSVRTIRQCLAGIKQQREAFDQVIFVDECSRDGTLEILAAAEGVEVIAMEKGGGSARARNLGARQARGDIIIFIDSDVQIPAHTVQVVKDKFRQRPELAAVCGIYTKTPLLEQNFIARYRAIQQHVWKKSRCGLTSFFACSVGAIKKEVFESIGGFAEHYMTSDIEDYEIALRLVNAGHQILQVAEIQGQHDGNFQFLDLVHTLFRRACLYPDVFNRRRKFDGYFNLSRALVYPLALFSLGSFFCSFWDRTFLLWWLLTWAVMVTLDGDLYRTFYKEYDLWFLVRATVVHYLMTMALALGYSWGSIKSFAGCLGKRITGKMSS